MTKHPAFNRHTLMFLRIFQRVAPLFNVLRPKPAHPCATHCDVLQQAGIEQRVAAKVVSTQWLGLARNSATLLLLIINNIVHVYVHMHAYRGSIGTAFEVLRPRSVGCAS